MISIISRDFITSSLILILTYFWKSVTSSGEILPFACTFATISPFFTDSPTFFSKQSLSHSQSIGLTARPAPNPHGEIDRTPWLAGPQ